MTRHVYLQTYSTVRVYDVYSDVTTRGLQRVGAHDGAHCPRRLVPCLRLRATTTLRRLVGSSSLFYYRASTGEAMKSAERLRIASKLFLGLLAQWFYLVTNCALRCDR